MQRPWTRTVGLIVGAGLWASLMGWAQAEPPACAKGNLQDYLGKECTVGDLSITFSKDYDAQNGPEAKEVGVAPEKQTGLHFTFPKLPKSDLVSIRFEAKAKGMKHPLTGARLAADLTKGVTIQADLTVGREKGTPEVASLRLNGGLIKATEGTFGTPTKSGVKVKYTVGVFEPGTEVSPTFTSTFSSATK